MNCDNSNDWDQSYEILTYYLTRKDFVKEIRGPEDIIYHNVGQIEPYNVIHSSIFYTPQIEEDDRPKRRRIVKF